MIPIPGTSRFSFKRWMSRLIWAFLWHSWDSFLRTQSIGAKRWACSEKYRFQGAYLSHCFFVCLCVCVCGGGAFTFTLLRELSWGWLSSFCFDDSYRMVVHLLLVLSHSFWDLHSFAFSSIFTKRKKLFFCAYPSRYPSSERELKRKTKLFYQLRGAWIPHEALRVCWSSKARKRFLRVCCNFDKVVCMSFEIWSRQ